MSYIGNPLTQPLSRQPLMRSPASETARIDCHYEKYVTLISRWLGSRKDLRLTQPWLHTNCMAGRKRGSVVKITSAKHNVRGLIVPQGAASALQRRSRYVLAGGSAVVGLLLGVWAVTALHRLHTRVDRATLQHNGFASAAVHDSHPQADALIQMHEAAATNAHQQHTTTDSLGVAAAVAAAAGALAAEGPEEAAGVAGQQQLHPHHQQQTQQVQVQVTVTHVEPEDQAVPLTHTNSNSKTLPRQQQQQQLQQQQVDQEAHDHTKTSSLPEHTVQESVVVSWDKVDKKNAESPASRHAGSQQGPAASHPKSSSSQHHPGPPPKVALLFLVKDRLANEAVWRAFFQAASELQLQPAVAAAAAKAAQANSQATISDAVGTGSSLHPDVGSFPAWVYPGYRVQHGLTPGADPPPAKPTHQAAAGAGAGGAAGQRVAAAEMLSSGSSSSTATFPAAAYPWEASLLQSNIRELAAAMAQAGQGAMTHTRQRQQQQGVLSQQQQQQEQQQPPWSPYQQLSTLKEALAGSAAAAGASSAAQSNTTGPAAPSSARSNSSSSASRTPPNTPQHQQQDQQVLVDQQRCLASLAAPAAAYNPATGPGPQQEHQQQQQQQLFSVYVHSPAGVLLPADSVLSGCELAVRLNTTRGYAQHVLAEAAALLLHAALSDPLNSKFVLVSDTSIPLYPPQVIWSQLLFEPLSRVDACITPGRDTQLSSRWRSVMATKHFGPQHWRKSSQWFTLSRPHALLAVADLHVREMLHRYCYTNLTRMYPICVSDEHWLPSLLASYNLDSQTDCEGASHYADWSAGGWHPKTYTAADLTPALVNLMRTGVPSKVAQLAALQQQQQHRTFTNPAAGAASSKHHDAWGGHQGHPRALLGVDGGLTMTPAALPPSSPVLQQAATGAGSQAAADSRSAAISMLQARARVAAAAMAAAAAECDSGRAVTTATHLIFRPHPPLVGVDERQKQEQEQQQHQHPSQQSAEQLAGADADGLAGGLPTNGSLEEEPHWLLAAGYQPLNQRCPLFARKFPEVDEVLPMALSCAGLQLGSWCHT